MNTTLKTGVGLPAPTSGADIADWRPEDEAFWESTGKRIAYRNLWISVPSLLCGFAIWGMWGIITVQMLNLGFPFAQAELFTLTAIAGLAGATMRIPASFLIRLAGGRNTIFLTTAMLLAPAIGTGIALQHKDWPLWVFQLMALWSGVGGGNFASSMSNISSFFPKRLQGTALGLNAGLGNFGVTTMQIVIPLVMTLGIFGAMGGEPMTLVKDSGWIFGKIAAGTPTYIQNAGFAWLLSLVPLSILCWFGMNNLLTVSPNIGGTFQAFAKITWLYTLSFVPAGIGLYLYLPKPTGLGLLNMWVAMPLIIASTLLVMKLTAFGTMGENIAKQFEIFRNKHTWAMTLLYIVTFGSFIGFSMALPLSITVIFGVSHVPDANGVLQHTLKNGLDVRVDRAVCRRLDPPAGRLGLRQGGRLHRHADHLGGDGRRLGRGRLRDAAGLQIGHAGAVFPGLHAAVRAAVRRQRHRQRLDLPHHRRDLRPPAGRPGAGLDLGGGGLRRLHRAGGDRRADQGRHAGAGDVRLRGVLCAVPGAELVVLPARECVREEPVTQSTTRTTP
jgi:MFS transporter, NNP family, nitrate/nitrite transporter